jgi:hypothetical protein
VNFQTETNRLTISLDGSIPCREFELLKVHSTIKLPSSSRISAPQPTKRQWSMWACGSCRRSAPLVGVSATPRAEANVGSSRRYFSFDVITAIALGTPVGFMDAKGDVRDLIANMEETAGFQQRLSLFPPIGAFARNNPLGRRLFVSTVDDQRGLGKFMAVRQPATTLTDLGRRTWTNGRLQNSGFTRKYELSSSSANQVPAGLNMRTHC